MFKNKNCKCKPLASLLRRMFAGIHCSNHQYQGNSNDEDQMKPYALLSLSIGLCGWMMAVTHADEKPKMPINDLKAVAHGNNAFAFDLYAKLGKAPKNLFYSPSSLSTALAMCYGGARGSTAQEMAKVLHFSMAQNQLHPAIAQLSQLLTTPSKPSLYQLSIANALWLQQDAKLEDAYVESMKQNYGAGIQLVDYKTKAEQARLTINQWVEERTQNKIKDLIKPGMLDAEMRLVLTNAIYFLGDWASPFEKDATYAQDFHLASGKMMQTDMMHQTSHMLYMENDQVQVLEKDYRGSDLSMVMILPKKQGALTDIERQWNVKQYDEWLSQLRLTRIALSLPKFTMNTEYELSKVLPEMGMPLAFSNQADFSGMSTSEPFKIGFVIHKAFVKVDEKGTEAAAATAIGMRLAGAPIMEKPIEFTADHPFIVILRDKRTGTILFMGRVMEPSAAVAKGK